MLFDRYIVGDWSANNRPKTGRDSIWTCLAESVSPKLHVANHRTRRAAEAWLVSQLTAGVRANERILLGLDFPYGYPAGFARALGLTGEPWQAIWAYLAGHVHDDDRNASNRFTVAADLNRRLGSHASFWGRPRHLALAGLPSLKEVVYRSPESEGLPEWRQVEQCLRVMRRWPQPAWKLSGAGAAGSQTLVGIPALHRLRELPMLRDVSRVWPFEVLVPDLPPRAPAVVHAEIWPSLMPFADEAGGCRDARQVRAAARHFRRLDRRGQLADLFAAAPGDSTVTHEEGWVLGVTTGSSSEMTAT